MTWLAHTVIGTWAVQRKDEITSLFNPVFAFMHSTEVGSTSGS